MVQVSDITGANIAEVDPTLKAVRVSQRPMECLGWYSYSLKTGACATLAANSTLLSVRYTGSNFLAVRRVGMGSVVTIYSAVGINDYALYVARSFTTADTGGTSVTITGNTQKHRTSLAAITSGNVNVATTTGLTVGTRTLDSQQIGSAVYYQTAVGAMLTPALDNLLAHNEGDYPLILAQDEGFVVNSVTLQSASTVVCYFNFEIAEITAF